MSHLQDVAHVYSQHFGSEDGASLAMTACCDAGTLFKAALQVFFPALTVQSASEKAFMIQQLEQLSLEKNRKRK